MTIEKDKVGQIFLLLLYSCQLMTSTKLILYEFDEHLEYRSRELDHEVTDGQRSLAN